MKRMILACAAAALALSGCAIVDYERYEGASNEVRHGAGGTKTTVDGIDVWGYGSPPRSFKPIGMVSITVPSGPIAWDRIKSNAAEKAKEMGGTAAINIDSLDAPTATAIGTAFGSNGSYATGTSVTVGRVSARYMIVKYTD